MSSFKTLKGYLRLPKSLETFLGSIVNSPKHARPIQNHMQKPQPESICQLATQGSPDRNRPSGLLDNARPNLQLSVNLPRNGSIFILSKSTSFAFKIFGLVLV